jgi:hypothetical protein
MIVTLKLTKQPQSLPLNMVFNHIGRFETLLIANADVSVWRNDILSHISSLIDIVEVVVAGKIVVVILEIQAILSDEKLFVFGMLVVERSVHRLDTGFG